MEIKYRFADTPLERIILPGPFLHQREAFLLEREKSIKDGTYLKSKNIEKTTEPKKRGRKPKSANTTKTTEPKSTEPKKRGRPKKNQEIVTKNLLED